MFASEGSVMRATLENNLGGVGYTNIFFMKLRDWFLTLFEHFHA